ncbi:MAG: efflux RND transporter periplasmic adaptor subunit [Pirellulales bacterium]|nr:efflux RND transporter periplasmic adaptor subunit [Pirellulales bacterium]
MNRLVEFVKPLAGPAVVVVILAAMWFYRDRVFSWDDSPVEEAVAESPSPSEQQTVLEISAQARRNLKLTSKPARPQTYWRSILIPGEIADRPGYSDRGIISPAVGIVIEIHAFPGDTMRPGESLFTLQLFSEYLQSTQTQLYKAKQETAIIQSEIDRLSGLASVGAVAKNKLIQLQNDIARQQTLIQSAKQELLTRGLTPSQIEQVENGVFVSTVEVTAPALRQPQTNTAVPEPVRQVGFATGGSFAHELAYEVQELSVELGQQVQSGQLLAKLSNHHALYIVGHAFKREAAFLEQAAQKQRPIDVEFAEDSDAHWPPLSQTFEIRHLSNSIDPDSRTFDFYIPLTNQSRAYEKNGEMFFVWRFRPGQRTRIHVPIEKYENVLVVPAAAVVREGPEAYVFRQNGDLFERLAVHVLHEDRQFAVIANDRSVPPGSYLAQGAAASLNRVLKAQSASGEQPGLHVHPDGTVHAAH